MNIQKEELCKAKNGAKGSKCSHPHWAHSLSTTSMCSATQKLSKPQCLGDLYGVIITQR